MNEPTSVEGWAIWDLVTQVAGHLKYAGMAGVVVGIDALSFLAVAEARGLSRALVAEMLPAIEAAVVTGIRKARDSDNG